MDQSGFTPSTAALGAQFTLMSWSYCRINQASGLAWSLRARLPHPGLGQAWTSQCVMREPSALLGSVLCPELGYSSSLAPQASPAERPPQTLLTDHHMTWHLPESNQRLVRPLSQGHTQCGWCTSLQLSPLGSADLTRAFAISASLVNIL